MKLAHFFVGFFIIFSSTFSFSQDSISSWKHKNTVGFDLSEIAFVNWSAGGQSSVSGLLKGDFNRTYKRQNVLWFNELIVRYGDSHILYQSTYNLTSISLLSTAAIPTVTAQTIPTVAAQTIV